METLVIAAVTSGAGAFRGVTGFGYAMVAAPGLSALFMAPSASVPFILFNDLLLTAFILGDRKHGAVDWRAATLLLSSGLVGAVCGSFVAAHLDAMTARIMVAGVVMLAACVALIHNPPAWLANRAIGVVTGLTAGLVISGFAVGGPLAVAWLLAGGTRRTHVRGTIAVFFGAIDLFALATRLFIGTMDPRLPGLLFTYTPLTLAGFAVGHVAARHLSRQAWHRVSSGGLVLIALLGFAQAVYSLATH